jgi:hypothetical protein
LPQGFSNRRCGEAKRGPCCRVTPIGERVLLFAGLASVSDHQNIERIATDLTDAVDDRKGTLRGLGPPHDHSSPGGGRDLINLLDKAGDHLLERQPDGSSRNHR